MTEQYIYSRSEREFVNALGQTIPLGFGFMALSPGMDNLLKQDVAVHCEDCPRLSQTDSQGAPLPLFRKAPLPNGRVLFQKSAWIEKGGRDFHVAHGYVLDDKEVRSSGPAKWLSMSFQLGDPNAVPGGVPPLTSQLELFKQKPREFRHLKDAALGLNSEQFCQMLLACFDALASRRQVLIAWDFEQPGEQDLRRSVLYWIYTCLPYELWTRLGFDSVYTDKSSPGLVQLAFVDITSVRDEGQTPSIQLKNQLIPLGGNFLIRDGEIIHNDGKYKTEWYHEDIIYAKWLGQLVNIVWKCPEDKKDAAAQALEEVRWSLQRRISSSKTEGQRLNPEDYRRACEDIYNLQNLREAAGLDKPKPPAVKRTAPPEKHEPSPAEVYRRISRECGLSPTAEDLKALAGIRGEMEPDVIRLLSAFMAREADEPNKKVSDVLRRYQTHCGSVYAQLPHRIFGDGLDAAEQKIWNQHKANSSADAARKRRSKWYGEMYDMKVDLTTYFRNKQSELLYASNEQCASMEKECFMWLLGNISDRHKIYRGRHNLDYPDDIRHLASMCSGIMGAYMMGHLGAFMVQAADAQGMMGALSSYRGLLRQSDVYSQLLRRIFWNEMTDEERSVWNHWGVENSGDVAKLRRFKWYSEVAGLYENRAEDLISFVKFYLNTLPGIDGQHRIDMEEELQITITIKTLQRNP